MRQIKRFVFNANCYLKKITFYVRSIYAYAPLYRIYVSDETLILEWKLLFGCQKNLTARTYVRKCEKMISLLFIQVIEKEKKKKTLFYLLL